MDKTCTTYYCKPAGAGAKFDVSRISASPPRVLFRLPRFALVCFSDLQVPLPSVELPRGTVIPIEEVFVWEVLPLLAPSLERVRKAGASVVVGVEDVSSVLRAFDDCDSSRTHCRLEGGVARKHAAGIGKYEPLRM